MFYPQSLVAASQPWGRCHCYPHFTQEDSKTRGGQGHMVARGKAEIRIQVSDLQSLHSALTVPAFPNVIPILHSAFQSILLHNCSKILTQQFAGVLHVSFSATTSELLEGTAHVLMLPEDCEIHEPGIIAALFSAVSPSHSTVPDTHKRCLVNLCLINQWRMDKRMAGCPPVILVSRYPAHCLAHTRISIKVCGINK